MDRRIENLRTTPLVTAAASSSIRQEAEGVLRARLPELQIDRHELTRSPKWVSARDGFLTGKNGIGRGAGANILGAGGLRADDPNRVAKAFVNEHAALFGHDASVLERAVVKRDYVTAHSGVRTTVWQQEHLGIEVFEAVFMAHTTKDGELVNVSSQFVSNEAQAAANGDPVFAAAGIVVPPVSAVDALAFASAQLGDEDVTTSSIEALDQSVGPDQRQRFRGGVFKGEANVRLCWLPMGEEELRLCWRMTLTSRAANMMFRIVVDAETGEVWVRHCLTDDISNATYRVYTGESPTPFSPAYPAPGNTNQPATVSRQLVTLAALDTTASPNGWINDGDNETRGNNVDAHTDLEDDNIADTPRPQGSPARTFDFALDLSQGPSSYRSAAVVNLFYWNNWIHDRLYQLGFTEGTGNFQNNNFGRGGEGNDAVQADAQDGGGDRNANFGTPEDGEAPRMQMYLWPNPSPDRDGDLDAQIIIHEYVHGLSNRRVGGGVLISAEITKSMGEGWSDFYAHTLLSSSGENPAAAYPLGAYAMYRYQYQTSPTLLDNYYFGIRRYPCSTDFSKNPLTYKDLDFNQADSHDGVPVSPLIPAISTGRHSRGEVWCVTLWEIRANLIAKLGFAAGNELALRIVTDGMGYCPPQPNHLQARDAIMQAENALTGGAHRQELWNAFARRGMGYYASAPAGDTTSGVVENFDAGPGLKVIPPANLAFQGRKGGPFLPSTKTLTLQNDTATPTAWSLFLEPPLEAGLVSGSVPGNQTRTVSVSLDANAAGFMSIGEYALNLTLSNHVTHALRTVVMSLSVLPDWEPVTEEFESGDAIDLEFQSLTFTPKGTNDYQVCRDARLTFHVPTANATVLNLTNDGFAKIDLAGGKRVRLFGKEYASVYASENGALTFTPPSEGSLSLEDHFNEPRLSAKFSDVNSSVAGRISWQQLTDRLVVSWEKVAVDKYIGIRTNSYQAEMFFDGICRITLLEQEDLFGIVGLSPGGGVPEPFVEADFSTRPDCDIPALSLAVAAEFTEGDGVVRGAGVVSVAFSRHSGITVNLTSSDTTEITVPITVTIPAGQASAPFDITVVNDSLHDGSQLAYVTATSSGFLPAQGRVRVNDDENNPLTVVVPVFAPESQGEFSGTIRVPNPVSGVVSIFLESSDTNEITVPPLVFMPAGQTSMVFKATVIDDRRIDGNLSTTVSATVPNWTSGSDAMAVFDNEDRQLRMTAPIFIWEGSGTLSNAGNVFLSGTLTTNLTVTLGTSNFFELLPLGPVTIPAGKTNALFTIGVGDNASIDGVRQVGIGASAPLFSNVSFFPFIFDNDQPPTPSNPYPPDDSIDWPLQTHLAWDAAEGELIVNGGFEAGDFTGWTVDGFGGGGWLLNDGALDPDSPDGPQPALAGTFSAVVVQNGNGKHTLSQEILVPEGATSGTMLRWRQEIHNHAGVFAANQRFAVELRAAATDALLATLYTTTTNDPAFSGPTNHSVSLAAWRGERVQIVFVEEDSIGELNVHLDNVSVIGTSAAQTTYDVYFGNDTVPDATEYLGSTTNAHWDLPSLAGGLNYYWRIDSRRLAITNTGPVWNFRTGGSSLSSVPLTFGSAWKYVATGANLGTAWRSPSYNDAIWQTGTAPLGFGSSQVTTIGAASNDVTTFYFRRRLTVLDTNRLASVTASLRRDDGAVVYVNGVEAFRDNMPQGRFDYLTQAASIVNGADETNSFVHAVEPSLFIEGTNIIAVEIHQRDNGFPLPGPSTDLFFDMAFTFRTNTGNLAPLAVNWVQPADFSVVRHPTNLSLRVGVVDDNLIGTRVTFFADDAEITEDFITPFQVTWTNPPVGLHTLLAVATDAGGLVRTSAPVHVLVTTAPGQSLLTLIPAGSVWRYRQNGEYPGRDWTKLNYKEPRDGSWRGGPAQLGYGDGDEATEFDFGLGFGFGRVERPITSYFRHQFQAGANLSSLTLRVLRDDGAAVYLNGTEVFRNNLPAGTISSNTLAVTTIGTSLENTWVSANLSPSVLVSGVNIAAAEIHQVSLDNVDLSFDLELTGLGNFLPSVTMTSPGADKALLSPPSVQIAASATDAYGSVTNVQFMRNGTLLGTDLTAPYQFLWNNPSVGVHTLTAVATDNLGATTTSAPIMLTIVSLATLNVRHLNATQVELSWPDSQAGYRIESTEGLEAPVIWVPLNLPVASSAGRFRFVTDLTETQRYFRLVAP